MSLSAEPFGIDQDGSIIRIGDRIRHGKYFAKVTKFGAVSGLREGRRVELDHVYFRLTLEVVKCVSSPTTMEPMFHL